MTKVSLISKAEVIDLKITICCESVNSKGMYSNYWVERVELTFPQLTCMLPNNGFFFS